MSEPNETEQALAEDELRAAAGNISIEIDRLRAENRATVSELTGLGARLDPAGMVQLRLEVLVEFLLPTVVPGTDELPNIERLLLEVRFEQAVANTLGASLSQVRQAALTRGVAEAFAQHNGPAQRIVLPGG